MDGLLIRRGEKLYIVEEPTEDYCIHGVYIDGGTSCKDCEEEAASGEYGEAEE